VVDNVAISYLEKNVMRERETPNAFEITAKDSGSSIIHLYILTSLKTSKTYQVHYYKIFKSLDCNDI